MHTNAQVMFPSDLRSAAHLGEQGQSRGTLLQPQAAVRRQGAWNCCSSPWKLPRCMAAFGRQKPTPHTHWDNGGTGGVLLSTAVTQCRPDVRKSPSLWQKTKFLNFFFGDSMFYKPSFQVGIHGLKTFGKRLEAIFSRWNYEIKLIEWAIVWMSMEKARSYQLFS